MRQSNLSARARSLSLAAAGRYNQRKLAAARKVESVGYYAGYDFESDRAIIKLANGQSVQALPVTTGAIALGEKVVVHQTEGGNTYFDSMP